jgi:hypothetical protein
MKTLLLISMILSTSAQAATFKCTGKNIRNGTRTAVQANFTFHMNSTDGTPVITEFKGNVVIADDEVPFDLPYSVPATTGNHPNKYKDFIRFDKIFSNGTKEYPTEYGFKGYLMIAKTPNLNGKTSAHYVFNADQDGGTIDLSCAVNEF